VGLDAGRFAEAGVVGHACARVSLRPLDVEAVTMVHLARRTDRGLEQLLHDQIEFTHLATFLPALHGEFGEG